MVAETGKPERPVDWEELDAAPAVDGELPAIPWRILVAAEVAEESRPACPLPEEVATTLAAGAPDRSTDWPAVGKELEGPAKA